MIDIWRFKLSMEKSQKTKEQKFKKKTSALLEHWTFIFVMSPNQVPYEIVAPRPIGGITPLVGARRSSTVRVVTGVTTNTDTSALHRYNYIWKIQLHHKSIHKMAYF